MGEKNQILTQSFDKSVSVGEWKLQQKMREKTWINNYNAM